MFRLLERKGEGVESLVGAEPDKTAGAGVDVGLEGLGVLGAYAAVEAIAGDHDVGLVLQRQRLVVLRVGLKDQFHAEF